MNLGKQGTFKSLLKFWLLYSGLLVGLLYTVRLWRWMFEGTYG
jgi:hypothetical protein